MSTIISPARTACPACGEPALASWRQAGSSEPELSRRHSYPLLRCAVCGSAILAGEENAEAAELYDEGAYSEPAARWGPLTRSGRRLITWDRRRMLGSLPSGVRVLEIGAGRGELLADLARRGYEVAGTEPAAASGNAALQTGAPVGDAPIEQLEREPASADLIILWHVLEHLGAPLAALERVRPWLAPGGWLIVAVPNLGSLQARIGGDRWFHQDVPRHRTQFTAAGLDRLLRRAGFERRRRRRPLIDQNPLGMWLTLLNRLTVQRDVPFRLVKGTLRHHSRGDAARDAAVTVVAGPLLLIPAVLTEFAATAAGKGGSLVVEAAPSTP